jgi:hypothetical protein
MQLFQREKESGDVDVYSGLHMWSVLLVSHFIYARSAEDVSSYS